MGFRQYRRIDPGEFFVVGYDLSSGMSDSCAIQFLSKTNVDVPLVYHAKTLATNATNAIIPVLERIFDVTGIPPVLIPERNAGGTLEIDRINGMNRLNKFKMYETKSYGNIINPNEKKYGWDTSSATRPKMLSDLKDAVDRQVIRIYDKPTINEMFSFIIARTTSTERAQAEQGAHDDLIMALAVAWQAFQTEEGRNERVNQVVQARNISSKRKWQIH